MEQDIIAKITVFVWIDLALMGFMHAVDFFLDMFWKIVVVLLIGFVSWAYKGLFPPPAVRPGSSGAPPVVGPRIKLRDGRHLSYKEHGVPKQAAKYKIILLHTLSSNKHDASITISEMVEKLGIYFISFDRPGHGESDFDPKRTIKSTVLDIEELADQLELGPRFYIIGTSMGGLMAWGCLKYIPHRVAGAALIGPVINYWWPGFPSDIAAEAYNLQPVEDQWALRVVHHAPWLVYWWNSQKWFPGSTILSGKPIISTPDLQVLSKLPKPTFNYKKYSKQQGVYYSFIKELTIGFGRWDFDPMDLGNPFPKGEGSVHIWHGVEDGIVPVSLQRYIAKKLPWIKYHELENAGHFFAFADTGIKDDILNALLVTPSKKD